MATATPDQSIHLDVSPNGAGLVQANASTSTTTSGVATTVSDGANDSCNADERDLKLSWLRRLPFEQVLNIVLKLDDFASEEAKAAVWPTDLKSASRSPDVVSSASNEVANEVVTDSAPDTSVETLVHPQAPPDAVPAPMAGIPTPPPLPPPGVPPVFPVPPMAALPPPPGVPVPAGYPYNPYAPFPPHPYTLPPPSSSSSSSGTNSSSPLFTSTPLVRSAPPTKQPSSSSSTSAHVVDEEPTLPSYEIMLHHALTVLNDPDGEAPKNLFSWIAVHYPVHTNFRPSASQALQKAFKRGRFEKTKDGKYRINHAWEGGSTSRRTTRRPANTLRHPLMPMFPPLPPYGYAPPPGLHPPKESGLPAASPPVAPAEIAPQTSEQIDAWEAAQSILQELNRQALKRLGQEGADASSSTAVPVAAPSGKDDDEEPPSAAQTPMPAFPMPIIAFTVDLDIGKQAAPESNASASTSNPPDNVQPLTGRAALQSHLVLLATQLAELAGTNHLLAIPTIPVG